MKSLHTWIQSLRSKLQATSRKTKSIDVEAVIADALASAGIAQTLARHKDAGTTAGANRFRNYADPVPHAEPAAERAEPGVFVWCRYEDGHDTLKYKLYIPSCYATSSELLPLIVMLHGCTQDPDDFAVGTRMNELAEQHAFVVAYPQQTADANSSKCWNWFRPQDQIRDGGEPKRIAGMTRALISAYRIDAKRVFVAGMSAGGAMAIIMGRTYPDVYAAVAVHSGLPYQSANNVFSALTVMKKSSAGQRDRHTLKENTPVIVFHGDRDGTVEHGNGVEIVNQAVANWPGDLSMAHCPSETTQGRKYTRDVYRDAAGSDVVESWTIHGAGHLWSGGDARGSHTDALGPNASEQFVRFFNAHAN